MISGWIIKRPSHIASAHLNHKHAVAEIEDEYDSQWLCLDDVEYRVRVDVRHGRAVSVFEVRWLGHDLPGALLLALQVLEIGSSDVVVSLVTELHYLLGLENK